MKRIALTILMLTIAISAHAKEVTLIAGLSLPPYIIQDSNSGMEFDVIKEALSKKGHTLKLKYVPFVRLTVDYKKYDGAITINESSGAKGHYSDVVMTYQNFAISLKSKGLQIDQIADLKDKKIVAFQNATKYLGPIYAETVKGNPKYYEQGKQELQVKMLYTGRSDCIVSDINIFKYYRSKVKDLNTSPEIVLHEIFKGVDYKALFNDASIKDDFNAGLKELKQSGRYDEIVQGYLK